MNIHAHPPTELLSPFIKRYLIIESQDGLLNRVLPDTSLVMAFRYKGQVNYLTGDSKIDLPVSTISGLRKSVRLINYSRDAGNILVIFSEAGAHAFLKEPLYELFDQSTSLSNLEGFQNISTVEEQLAGAATHTQRIDLIERFLLTKLNNHKSDLLIFAALEKIRSANGIIKIKDLAHSLCISQDPFEKRFRRAVGVSPKQFSYITRMKSVTNGIKNQTLAETAFKAGYFDQPHFNKDFKLFTGLTPTEFIKSPVLW